MVMTESKPTKRKTSTGVDLSVADFDGNINARRQELSRYIVEAHTIDAIPLVRDLEDVRGTWLDGLSWTGRAKKGDEPLYRPASTTANVTQILNHDVRWLDCLAYDAFAEDVIKALDPPWHEDQQGKDPLRGPWSDIDTTRLEVWLDKAFGMKVGQKSICAAVAMVAKQRTVHPVRDYLERLEWDGKERIGTFLKYLFGAPDSPYIRAIGRAWLISAVARVMQPGCKVDTMLILEGPQGIRKSSALRALTSDAWFVELSSAIDPRETAQLLRGKWIGELPELAAFKRTRDSETIKSFLSRQFDTYRAPYAFRSQDFPRQSVLAGSTNEERYVKDPTGARRLWPVPCSVINVRHVEIERDQLWAEATLAFKRGDPWYLTDDSLVKEAVAAQSDRFEESPWTQPVADYCEKRGVMGVTVEEVMISCLGIDLSKWTHKETGDVGVILRRQGWEPRGRSRPRRYFPAAKVES